MKRIPRIKQQFGAALKALLTTPNQAPTAGIVLTTDTLGIAYVPDAFDNDQRLVLYTAAECGTLALSEEARGFTGGLETLDATIESEVELNTEALLNDIFVASFRATPQIRQRIENFLAEMSVTTPAKF